jgi:hypothetical protein
MKAYFVFFLPKGIPAHPIAIYFDKKKAYEHMKTANREYVQLRLCDWKDGILPCWSETSFVDVPVPKPKKKKLTTEPVLSKVSENESNNRIPVT